MTLLSSPKPTQFYKRDGPLVIGLIASAFVLLGLYQWTLGNAVMMYFITAFVTAATGWFAWITLRYRVLDEVYDLGNRLLIRNVGMEVTVPLGDIVKVEGLRGKGMLIVQLTFNSVTALGRTVSFYREGRWNRHREDPFVEELRARIGAHRLH